MDKAQHIHDRSLPEAVLDILGEGRPLVLATMVDQNGSAPRKAGARMLVKADGDIWGTVGGGDHEAEVITLARRLLREETSSAVMEGVSEGSPGAVLKYSLRDNADTDVIGGRLTMLLEVIAPDSRSRQVFTAALEAGQKLQPFVFHTSFVPHGDSSVPKSDSPCEGALLARIDKAWAGAVQRHLYRQKEQDVVPNDIRNLPANILAMAESLKDATPRHIVQDGKDYFLELCERPFRVVIFGGGHVAHELARVARCVAFPVAVVDDRAEFANIQNFPDSEIVVLESLSEEDAAACMQSLHVEPHDAIVIVTRGHAHDRDVLAASLRTNAGYIGMIGSKPKRTAIYESMRSKGFSQKQLDFIHSPIGLSIGASSPQEIAVSIVAELIQWRKATRDAAKVKR